MIQLSTCSALYDKYLQLRITACHNMLPSRKKKSKSVQIMLITQKTVSQLRLAPSQLFITVTAVIWKKNQSLFHMLPLHLPCGSTGWTLTRIFCRILIPCPWSNFAQNVTSSSAGRSDWLARAHFIDFRSVFVRSETRTQALTRGTGQTSGQTSGYRDRCRDIGTDVGASDRRRDIGTDVGTSGQMSRHRNRRRGIG